MPDIENRIRLAKLESPRSALALLDHFGSPDEVFHASVEEMAAVEGLTRRTAERVRILASEPVDAELRALEKVGARVVTYRDAEYPANLRQISDPPPVLFVRGEIREEDRFAVAIVGTRRPSVYGRCKAAEISRDLAKRGLCVVSGGAHGVDTEAHKGALEAGGRTIAVFGTAIDEAYPQQNAALFREIAEHGAVISEFAPGTPAEPWRFPVRNRIVSGLAMGVLIVESLLTGGAMITATIAAEQGRDVWAVPGATDTPQSEGPHLLIREGAKLAERADDILRDLGVQVEEAGRQRPAVPSNLTPEQKAVLQVLSLHPKHVDEIIGECKLAPAAANSTLTMLEMLGLIRRVPGNSYVRTV